jgi:uncharacterized membrane protein
VTWFRVRHWVADSLWVIPLVCGVAAWALSVVLIELDDATPSIAALDFTSSTATQLLAAFAGAAVAFTGFAFSVLLLVVQLASSQLSPRATRLAYRSLLSKISLGLWVGTLAYTVSVLESVTGSYVPQLSVAGAGILVFISVVVFLLLIGRTSRILRPAPMSQLCAVEGRKSIARVHPEPFGEAPAPATPGAHGPESSMAALPLPKAPCMSSCEAPRKPSWKGFRSINSWSFVPASTKQASAKEPVRPAAARKPSFPQRRVAR